MKPTRVFQVREDGSLYEPPAKRDRPKIFVNPLPQFDPYLHEEKRTVFGWTSHGKQADWIFGKAVAARVVFAPEAIIDDPRTEHNIELEVKLREQMEIEDAKFEEITR